MMFSKLLKRYLLTTGFYRFEQIVTELKLSKKMEKEWLMT